MRRQYSLKDSRAASFVMLKGPKLGRTSFKGKALRRMLTGDKVLWPLMERLDLAVEGICKVVGPESCLLASRRVTSSAIMALGFVKSKGGIDLLVCEIPLLSTPGLRL